MATKIHVQVDVLQSLASDYRKYGQDVQQAYRTTRSRVERELEPLFRTYSSYSSVTSKMYELQDRLRSTEHSIRELHDLSQDLGRRLQSAVDVYTHQERLEKELIRQIQAGRVSFGVASVGLAAGSHGIGQTSGTWNVNISKLGGGSNRYTGVIEDIEKKVNDVFSSLNMKMRQAAEHIKVSIDTFSNNVQRVAISIGNTVKTKLEEAADGVDQFLKKSKDAITNFFVHFDENVKAFFEKIFQGVKKLIDDIVANKEKILATLKHVGIIILDSVQFVLDILGLIPVYGEIADGINAVIYLLRGDYMNAGLSLAAMIPFAGWAATGGKIAGKLAKFANKIHLGSVVDKVKDAAAFVSKHGNRAMDYITKKTNDVWNQIKHDTIVAKVADFTQGFLNKGYELRALIDKQADRLRINIDNWWERQYQLGIVPPQMGDFFRPKKPKHDVNANVELNEPNPNKTPDVKTDLETPKTDADLKSPDKVVDRGVEGAGNALQSIKSLDDILNDPSKLKGIKPDELYKYLKDNGYIPIPLNKSEKYKGIPFEEGGGFRVNWGGDRILQYHPGSRHHGGVPYYKISSGRTGTKRYDTNGNPID